MAGKVYELLLSHNIVNKTMRIQPESEISSLYNFYFSDSNNFV